ncbi:MAG: acetylglutamate kinase, partial [Muribaculaceae bacterium]|nr:acetylglutamate kinase [Muribaculaceae bacterium]
DMHCIISVKRPATPVDYGEVGDVDTVNSSSLKMLLDNSITPVLCAITADYDGNLLNTNADTIATCVAKAMSEEALTRLIFCFEKDGVLADVNNAGSVIRTITPDSVDELIARGVISDGMIPKVTNAIKAITTSDLDSVIIKSSTRLHDDSGTCISK